MSPITRDPSGRLVYPMDPERDRIATQRAAQARLQRRLCGRMHTGAACVECREVSSKRGRAQKAAQRRAANVCRAGHPWQEETTRYHSNGRGGTYRVCLLCQNMYAERRRHPERTGKSHLHWEEP